MSINKNAYTQSNSNTDIIEIISMKLDYAPFSVKFQPNTPNLSIAGGYEQTGGIVQLYSFKDGALFLLTEAIFPSSLKSSTFKHSNYYAQDLAIGGFDGYLSNIDLEKGTASYTVNKAHQGIIIDMDGIGGCLPYQGTSLLLTASKDGYAKIWDTRVNKNAMTFENKSNSSDSSSSSHECWAACFINKNSICTGYENGDIKIFDLRNQKAFFEKNLNENGVSNGDNNGMNNGICSIKYNKDNDGNNILGVTTFKSKVYLFDLGKEFSFKGDYNMIDNDFSNNSSVSEIKFIPRVNKTFISYNLNGNINIWKYSFKKSLEKISLVNSKTMTSGSAYVGFDFHGEKEGLAASVSLYQTLTILYFYKIKNLNEEDSFMYI